MEYSKAIIHSQQRAKRFRKTFSQKQHPSKTAFLHYSNYESCKQTQQASHFIEQILAQHHTYQFTKYHKGITIIHKGATIQSPLIINRP